MSVIEEHDKNQQSPDLIILPGMLLPWTHKLGHRAEVVLMGAASTVTTFLCAQTAELCCEAAPELICLQTEVCRLIERQFPVFPKILGFLGNFLHLARRWTSGSRERSSPALEMSFFFTHESVFPHNLLMWKFFHIFLYWKCDSQGMKWVFSWGGSHVLLLKLPCHIPHQVLGCWSQLSTQFFWGEPKTVQKNRFLQEDCASAQIRTDTSII